MPKVNYLSVKHKYRLLGGLFVNGSTLAFVGLGLNENPVELSIEYVFKTQ